MIVSARSVVARLLAGVVCLGGILQATPFTKVDAATTCFSGYDQQFCTLTGNITGPSGAVLPSLLADLATVKSITGEGLAVFDRSGEMDSGRSLRDEAIVAGPMMFTSVQMSFDARMDLSPQRQLGAREARRQALRREVSTGGGQPLDIARIELTLGTALSGGDEEKSIGQRELARASTINFALVNAVHTVAETKVEEPSEDDAVLQ